MSEGKRYGLIISKKSSKSKLLIKKPSIFGDDSDEESRPVSSQSQPKASGSKLKRKTQIEIDQALAEDPTVYEYDEIYDDIKGTKKSQEKPMQKTVEKKSKYIDCLLKYAAQRKKTYERQVEKKVQKERTAEEGMFDDKEAFVTSAYKKKMQEMQEEEERERKKAEMEDMLDVRKQKDLSGFYRHIYAQTTGEEPVAPAVKVKDKQEEPVAPAVKAEEKQEDSRSSTEPIKVEDFPEDKDLSMSESSDTDSGSSSDSEKHRSRRVERKRKERDDEEDRDKSRIASKAESRNRDSSQDRERKSHVKDRESDRDKAKKHSKSEPSERVSDRERHSHRERHDSRYKDKERYSERHNDKTGDDGEKRHREDKHKEDRHGKDKNRHHSRKQNRRNEKEDGEQKVDKPSEDDMKSTAAVCDAGDNKRPTEDSPALGVTCKDSGEERGSIAKYNKRTIGDNLDDAKARYLARKKARPTVTVQEDD